MKRYVLILTLAMPLTAAAQFFDHFEGNTLGNHWSVWSEGTQWEYDVSNSVLNVTRLYGGPGAFKEVYLYAQLDLTTDFEMIALVGWDDAQFQRLVVTVGLGDPFLLRTIGGLVFETRPSWQTPRVTAGFNGGGSNSVNAPRSGMHEFRMTRTGDAMTAHFDGQLVHEASGTLTDQAQWVMFEFNSDESLQFAPLHVDMIQVVPEPATFVVLGIGAICAIVRRRRCRDGG